MMSQGLSSPAYQKFVQQITTKKTSKIHITGALWRVTLTEDRDMESVSI